MYFFGQARQVNLCTWICIFICEKQKNKRIKNCLTHIEASPVSELTLVLMKIDLRQIIVRQIIPVSGSDPPLDILKLSDFTHLVSGDKCIEFEHGTDRNAVHSVIPQPYASNNPSYWHFG